MEKIGKLMKSEKEIRNYINRHIAANIDAADKVKEEFDSSERTINDSLRYSYKSNGYISAAEALEELRNYAFPNLVEEVPRTSQTET